MTPNIKILVGYEVGSGEPVHLTPKHTMITGMTGDAGKTTAIEGIASRWPGQKFIVFLAKPGEESFSDRRRILPFFRQQSGWQYVEALIEAALGEKVKIVRTTLIKVCEGTKNLDQVFGNVSRRIADYDAKGKGGFEYDMLIQVREYLRQVIKELETHKFAPSLDLNPGINVVDISEFTPVMQAMVVGAISEEILRKHDHTSIVIPEAWQTIPGDRKSPATAAVEALIRQGRVRHNFVLIDSQDIAGVNTKIRRHIANYLLGKQQDEHEIERTLKAITLPAKSKPRPDEIQTLKLGQFFAIMDEKVRKIYARPSWMEEEAAISVARGHVQATLPVEVDHTPVVHADEDVVTQLDQAVITDLQKQVVSLQAELSQSRQGMRVMQEELSKAEHKADAEEDRANENAEKVQKYDELADALKALILQQSGEIPRTDYTPTKIDIGDATAEITVQDIREPLEFPADSIAARICLLQADGFFDTGRSDKDVHEEYARHWDMNKGDHPSDVKHCGSWRKTKLVPGLQMLSRRRYQVLKAEGAVWVTGPNRVKKEAKP